MANADITRNRLDVITYVNEELGLILLERFPFLLGRIDWQRVPGAIHGGFTASDPRAAVDQVVRFLSDCLVGTRLVLGVVAVFGDAHENEYVVRPEEIRSALLLLENEHGYVFPVDGSWCLQWSMEETLHFGIAPPKPWRR